MSTEAETADPSPTPDIPALMDALGAAARSAARTLARVPTEQKDRALKVAAAELRARVAELLAANERDLKGARQKNLSAALIDRLELSPERIEGIARGLEDVVALPDPVGGVSAEWERPNGLRIQRVRVPLGVIGIIYESRPNVTADAGALCLKAGNAAILRGGSESFESSAAIHACLTAGLRQAGLPETAIQHLPTADRAAVGYLLSSMGRFVDVIVPRGGKNLIARVQAEARVPVIGHLEGICHVYVDRAAETEMAERVTVNAKMRRTGICGAAETVLFDRAADPNLVRGVLAALIDAGCEVRADPELMRLDQRLRPAEERDFSTEYLDAIISARMVDGVDGAVAHIARCGSGHTETIITADPERAEAFLAAVDSAIVLHNASTQFADGGEFGMGAEIGIATGKLHARGPVGAEQLTSYKYVVRGSGQTRP